MAYSLAVDSGGTKVQAVLYDDRFCAVNSCRVGSMRSNTTPEKTAQKHCDELVDRLGIRGKKLNRVGGILEPVLRQTLETCCCVDAFCQVGEAEAGFCAAQVFCDGCLVVAGTGATVFVRKENREYSAGGYGSAVADEGSGYWIGREGCMAAIRDYEERGPGTVLTDLIAAHMGGTRHTLRERIFAHVYMQTGESPVSHVAACARLVSRAADMGDETACDILRRAGHVLAAQAASMLARHNMPCDSPVALSGSVWRAGSMLQDAFLQTLAQKGWTGSVHRPLFEPIVGMVIAHHQQVHGGFSAWDRGRFRETFDQYLYERA